MSIADNKYVAFTTYRKNGEAKTTPVWIADLGDDTVGFTTSSSSWKARRLANDPRVKLQPSNAKGVPVDGSEAVEGTATAEAADLDRVMAAVKDKYGWQVTMMRVVGKVAGLFGKDKTSDAGVVITLT
ncbi:MAG: PPOX class F420-dependent oxidoreductase [Actinomycetia bacterium]|nr:PPOX class F420-dependent oxidoreductase [Actinomycetes bacterium]MCP4958877.1 PPOX class F420-dependent oxidoreductase [Actinomycetes bacterium]